MARQDYYPDYYLRKRQRDAVFNRVWKTVIVVAIIGFGITAGVLFYMQIIEPRRQPSDNTSELAGLKGDLEAQDRLQNADIQTPKEEVDETARELQQETKLEEIAFVQSFPEVHISVTGSNEPVKREGATAADQQPPEEETATTETADAAQPEEKPATAEEKPKPAAKPAAKEEVKEPAKKPEKEPEQPKKPAPSGGSGYEFKIYAGSYGSQDAADEAKRGLGGLGLTGKIIKNGADYNLLVGTLSDFEAALALRTKLEGSGYSGSFVTRKTR